MKILLKFLQDVVFQKQLYLNYPLARPARSLNLL